MSEPLRVGIAGLGTVGCGLVDIIQTKQELLRQKTGRNTVITAVSARDKSKQRDITLPRDVRWFEDATDLAQCDEVDCVVELIGGSDGLAKTLCETALTHQKHVVTANKALIAHHGRHLAAMADKHQCALLFEAAVAGGIPVIKMLKDALTGNHITKVSGILNGTCNYILSTMQHQQRDFDDVLREAQALGYAEADPTFDVDGIDAAHKLSILATFAYARYMHIDDVACEGIRQITLADIEAAAGLGYAIRLIGVAEQTGASFSLRVHPALLPANSTLGQVEDVYNAVEIEADELGTLFIKGEGAGRRATASAVASDLADIARGAFTPTFTMPHHALSIDDGAQPSEGGKLSAYYLRLNVDDTPGVLSAITSIFANAEISVATLHQYADNTNDGAVLIITTHHADHHAMRDACDTINAHTSVRGHVCMIRIES